MKTLITITTAIVLLFYTSTNAKSGEYENAVIGHVISEKLKGTDIDTSKLMEQELQKLAHQFTIESIFVLQKYLPSILDGIAADLRLKADNEYKCKLLEGSPNGCKQ